MSMANKAIEMHVSDADASSLILQMEERITTYGAGFYSKKTVPFSISVKQKNAGNYSVEIANSLSNPLCITCGFIL
jgi:hypothetical protein